MKELIGKSCKIGIKVRDKDYFYTVREVTNYDEPHLTFIDKYDKTYTYHKDNIVGIREVKEAW